jgi:transposase
MFVLSEGIPWRKLPARFGAFQTVNLYFLEWARAGVFEELDFEVLRILGYVKF